MTWWPDDSATSEARERFQAVVEGTAQASRRLAMLSRTRPPGSILFGINLYADRRRRMNKRAPAKFARDRRFYLDLQAARLEATRCSKSGFYAKLFRQAPAPQGYLFRKRAEGLRRLTTRIQGSQLRACTLAWRSYVAKCRRARVLFSSQLVSHQRRCFQGWCFVVLRRRRINAMLCRVLGRHSRAALDAWRFSTLNNRRMRRCFRAWQAFRTTSADKRAQIARYLLRGSTDRLFDAWRTVVRNERQARRFKQRFDRHTLVACFHAWLDHRDVMRHVKAAVARLLGSCLSAHFAAWARFASIAAHARRFNASMTRQYHARLLRTWREQARVDRLDRIGLLDPAKNSDLLAKFYQARLPVCRSLGP